MSGDIPITWIIFPALWCGQIAFVAGGVLAGVLQQRILRRQVCHSAWWVPASAAGWGLNMIGLGLIGLANYCPKGTCPFVAFIGFLVPAVLGAILLGIITGGALIWLLRQPVQQTTDTCKKLT
jgi:hypothetical protein